MVGIVKVVIEMKIVELPEPVKRFAEPLRKLRMKDTLIRG